MVNIARANISRSGDGVAYSKINLYMSFRESSYKRLKLMSNKTLSVTGVWHNGGDSYDTIIYEFLECKYFTGELGVLHVDSSGAENWLYMKETKETI